MGAVSALGETWPATARALAEGKVAIHAIRSFDGSGLPCGVASEVSTQAEAGDRRAELSLRAAREAWTAADVRPGGRVGVFMGAESGRVSFQTLVGLSRAAGGRAKFDEGRFAADARPFADALSARHISPSAVASAVAREVGATTPVESVSLACASGSAAMAMAVRALRTGECDVAVCGGVGADVDPMVLAGFSLLDALSRRGVSRPFDVRRDGFVVGEGAAVAVLATERGAAKVEVLGVGLGLDAWRITAPDPEGRGAARAMRAALAEAGPGAIDYVQAHGTSTPLNDVMESKALNAVLGESDGPLVSSVKGALGHWIAGAGALGFLCAHEAISTSTVFPTAGLERPDPECALRHVVDRALRSDVRRAMVNSFAFGGANCTLVLGACA